MKRMFRRMLRSQVQDELSDLNVLSQKPIPKGGWINTIKKALGMSTAQLADRVGCSPQNIIASERREREGNISLDALEKIAQAMNCKMVYFFIPIKSMDELRYDQAMNVAKKQLEAVSHSMSLELQGLSKKQQKKQEDEIIQELLGEGEKQLWDDAS